jgi:hypothetical protein
MVSRPVAFVWITLGASVLGCGDENALRDTATDPVLDSGGTENSSPGSSESDPSSTSTSADDTTAATATGPASTGDSESHDDDDTSTGAMPIEPVTIAVVSDLNGSYGSTTYQAEVHAAAAAVVALAPDVVLSTGDMVAGQQAGLDYGAMWAGFHAAVSDPLARAGIPFAVSPGNHDASAYGGFEDERQIYVDEWTPRKPELEWIDDSAWPLYYSFTMGSVLFVALDSTTIGPLPAVHMAWIEEQLVAGAEKPVKILYGHVPLWPFAQGREDEVIGDPTLEGMLVEHDVTMFVSGHHHAYYPGKKAELGLVSMACLGAGPRALIGDGATSPRSILRIEVTGEGEVQVLDALGGAAFDQPIDRATLPMSLTYGGVTITRDDVR